MIQKAATKPSDVSKAGPDAEVAFDLSGATVEAGEEVIIARDDTPVARIVPALVTAPTPPLISTPKFLPDIVADVPVFVTLPPAVR